MVKRSRLCNGCRFCSRAEQNKDYLTELDSAIGDADHGINMDRGFKR